MTVHMYQDIDIESDAGQFNINASEFVPKVCKKYIFLMKSSTARTCRYRGNALTFSSVDLVFKSMHLTQTHSPYAKLPIGRSIERHLHVD